MRKVLIVPFILFVAVALLLNSCTKSSPIGSDLVAGDQANIKFVDTLTILTATVKEDSVIAFLPSSPFSHFLLGDYADPIFGNTTASFSGQLKSIIAITNDFSDAMVDSIVLSLAYDPVGFYGNTEEPYTVSVYRLNEVPVLGQAYYSNETFDYDPVPLATKTFTPSLDSISLDRYLSDPTESGNATPQLRIPLSTIFADEILAELQLIYSDENSDFSNFQKDSVFLEYFKGLHVRAENPTNGVISFNLSIGTSSVNIYYKQIDDDGEEDKSIVSFAFNASQANDRLVKMTHINHSFPQTIVDAFDDFSTGEEILYLQGLSGPNILVDIPYATSLKNTIINKAELEFTIGVEDSIDFELPLVIAMKTRDDGIYFDIPDFDFAQATSLSVFGGTVEQAEGGRQIYKMNIASIFQDLVDGEIKEPLFLRLLSKQEQARRVTLLGAAHNEYPVKLRVTYTRLNE